MVLHSLVCYCILVHFLHHGVVVLVGCFSIVLLGWSLSFRRMFASEPTEGPSSPCPVQHTQVRHCAELYWYLHACVDWSWVTCVHVCIAGVLTKYYLFQLVTFYIVNVNVAAKGPCTCMYVRCVCIMWSPLHLQETCLWRACVSPPSSTCQSVCKQCWQQQRLLLWRVAAILTK